MLPSPADLPPFRFLIPASLLVCLCFMFAAYLSMTMPCFVEDVHAIWQPDEFKAASGVVVKSDGDDRSIPRLDEAIDSS